MSEKEMILYVSKDAITPAKAVVSGKAIAITTEKEIPWKRGALGETLKGIKKKHGDSFRILLDDALCFVFSVEIPEGTENERELVRMKAAEDVPEALGEFGWDFKDVLRASVSADAAKIVQFASVESSFFDEFSEAVRVAELHVVAMEPVSCALGRLVADRDEALLVLHKSARTLALVSYRGLILATRLFEGSVEVASLLTFLDFVKERRGIYPKGIILSGTFPEIDTKKSEFSQFKIESQKLDPLGGIAKKADLDDGDEAVLNIVVGKERGGVEAELKKKLAGSAEPAPEVGIKTYEVITPKESLFPISRTRRLFIVGVFFVSLLITAMNGYILYERAAIRNLESTPNPLISKGSPNLATTTIGIPREVATTTVSSTVALDLSRYTIAVLNGSGKSGEATRVANILTSRSFVVTQKGNADRFDYASTTTRFKKDIPIEFKTMLTRTLESSYTVGEGRDLDPGEKVDVIVILGRK